MPLQKSVNIAISLDGFIAREDNAIDWLDRFNKLVPEGEDCGFGEFMASVDCIAMGSGTFRKILSFNLSPEQWPYGDAKILVLSRSNVDIPVYLQDRVEQSSAPIEKIVSKLESEDYQRLYVDGGITIQRFLAAGLLDDITLTVIPTLIGKGKPLFSNKIFSYDTDIDLELIATKQYEFGFTQLTYKVKNN